MGNAGVVTTGLAATLVAVLVPFMLGLVDEWLSPQGRTEGEARPGRVKTRKEVRYVSPPSGRGALY